MKRKDEKMYKDLLPIGSVVLLKGGEKRLMVCGRVVCSGDSEEIHDYVGCYYPSWHYLL